MSAIRLTVNTSAVAAKLKDVEQRQIPFATVVALNELANRVQAAERAGLRKNFTIAPDRQTFFDRMIKIAPADRASKKDGRFHVTIQVQGPEATSRRGDRTALLTRHEDGGVHRALDFSHPFFVPTRALRPGAYDVAPRQYYPASLRLVERRGVTGILPALKGRVLKGKRATRGSGNSYFILGTPTDSKIAWGIYERFGSDRGDIRLLWAFDKTIRLKPRLHFEEIAQATVVKEWPAAFAVGLVRALSTAR